jgi:hypothetical protein
MGRDPCFGETRVGNSIKTKRTFGHSYSANAMSIEPTHAVADIGATSVFVMTSNPVKNKRLEKIPISISLSDEKKVQLTHICDVMIPGLPIALPGHILPEMMMASLLGIRVLCKAGCKVLFDDTKCQVI